MARFFGLLVMLAAAVSGLAAAERRVDLFSEGRVSFQNAKFKEAAKSFRALAELHPDNPEYVLWLGRAYGRQADISNPLETRKYTQRALRCFERAVELDPTNDDARRELHSYPDEGLHSASDVFVRVIQLPSDALGLMWH